MAKGRRDFAGVRRQDEIAASRTIRPDKRPGEIFKESLIENEYAVHYYVVAIILTFLLPFPWEPLLLLIAIYGVLVYRHRVENPLLPAFTPKGANVEFDLNDPIPGNSRKKFAPPSAEIYVGIDSESNKQVWFKFANFLRHLLVFGGTGSGKSVFLQAVAQQFVIAGGSVIHTDAKAGKQTPFTVAWWCHRYGREDDFLIQNYIKPNPNKLNGKMIIHTNTNNPTTDGEEKEIANTIISLMPDMKGNGGGNQSFYDNAVTLVRSLTAALVDLRDQGHAELTWDLFREYMVLPKFLELAENKDGKLREVAAKKVLRMAGQISGVALEKGPNGQDQMAYNQYGFITSYTLTALSQLTDNYGYIFGAKYGDISYRDAVFRGRMFLAPIPALQNTEEELRMLGKISLQSTKLALAESLPSKFEGTARSAIKEELYRKGIVPSINIADEYQALQNDGYSIVVQQARELGFAVMIGLQNNSGLGEKLEAENFVENTDIKMLGANKGPDTTELMQKITGKRLVSQTEGRTSEKTTFFGSHDKYTTTYVEKDKINIQDITDQIEGEFHLAFRNKVIRVETPYFQAPIDARDWDFPEQAAIVMNGFCDLSPVDVGTILDHEKSSERFDEIVEKGWTHEPKLNSNLELYRDTIGTRVIGFERIIAVIQGHLKTTSKKDSEWVKPSMGSSAPVVNPKPKVVEPTDAKPASNNQTAPASTKSKNSALERIISGAASSGALAGIRSSWNQDEEAKKAQQAEASAKEENRKQAEVVQQSLFDQESDDEVDYIEEQDPDELLFVATGDDDKLKVRATKALLKAALKVGLSHHDIDPTMLLAIQDVIGSYEEELLPQERDAIVRRELVKLKLMESAA